MNDTSKFDLLTSKFEEKMPKQKLTYLDHFWTYLCAFRNISYKFEMDHAMMMLSFDSDLKFNVKYWPKFWT